MKKKRKKKTGTEKLFKKLLQRQSESMKNSGKNPFNYY